MDDDRQLIVSTFNDGHQQRQVPSIFDLSAASAADSKATSPEDLLHSWNSIHSAIRSLDPKLAKRLLREWQELKIEDVNLGGLSLDILKRMKPSELDKLMQGMTIAHIGEIAVGDGLGIGLPWTIAEPLGALVGYTMHEQSDAQFRCLRQRRACSRKASTI